MNVILQRIGKGLWVVNRAVGTIQGTYDSGETVTDATSLKEARRLIKELGLVLVKIDS